MSKRVATHYKDRAIQPVEYIHANGIGFFEATSSNTALGGGLRAACLICARQDTTSIC